MTTTEQRGGDVRVSGARGRPLPLWYSLVLGIVLTAATAYGLLVHGVYRVSPGIRSDFAEVMRGQDLLTLVTVPVLVLAAVRARAGALRWHLLWLGLLLYYLYSYVAYAFAPYDDAFLLYVAVLGLSGYGLLDGLLRLDVHVVGPATARVSRRAPAWFLIGVAALFLVLWMALILPAIPGDLPGGRMTYDIPSAVHVLDLAFVLPLLFATGRMLLRHHPAGPALGTVLLCKLVTLGLALLSMSAFSSRANPGEAALWAVIVLVSGGLLVRVLRQTDEPSRPFLRDGLWC